MYDQLISPASHYANVSAWTGTIPFILTEKADFLADIDSIGDVLKSIDKFFICASIKNVNQAHVGQMEVTMTGHDPSCASYVSTKGTRLLSGMGDNDINIDEGAGDQDET